MSEPKLEKDDSFRAPDELLQAQALANLLDYAVRIPVLGIRVGLDSLVGLIPVLGDALMFLASTRIIYLGYKMSLPRPLLANMLRNSLFDMVLGFIPVVGDVFDLFFKANIKNVRIMEQYWVSQNKDIIDAQAKKTFDDWQKKLDQ